MNKQKKTKQNVNGKKKNEKKEYIKNGRKWEKKVMRA